MKKLFKKAFLVLLPITLINNSLKASEPSPSNPYQSLFNNAYVQYPSIPKGILEAVAFGETRFQNLNGSQEASCTGMPKASTVFGLYKNGANYFRENFNLISTLSGYNESQINNSVKTSILAYAKAYSILQAQKNIDTDVKNQAAVLIALSHIPLDGNLGNKFALDSYLFQIYWFLNQAQFQNDYQFIHYNINLAEIFPDNYEVLSSPKITYSDVEIGSTETGVSYKLNSGALATLSTDYGPAIFTAAASCNYNNTSGSCVPTAITIHDVEGSYAGCISWFQNCAASVSAHYVIRSSDGQVTQMVVESKKAYHVGSENGYCIGIEHEGYNNVSTWYTNAMYNSSAALCRDICTSGYGINPLKTYNGPACNGVCTLGSCPRIKGHQHFPGQNHNDPGQYWNWYKFYTLINNTPVVNTITTASGSVYDSGGASANYNDNERFVQLIQPLGATSISLNFTVFNLENTWDYLYIYDGANTNASLIGRFTGSTLPGNITSTSNSLLLDFRSDCATTLSGFAANFSSNGTITPTPSDAVAPTTQVVTPTTWVNANFTSTISDIDNTGGSGVQKGFYNVSDFDGTSWSANQARGFFTDEFSTTISSAWTPTVGTWSIQSNSLYQSDESNGNTNISAALTQTLSNRDLYHFNMKIGGSGTQRRAGFHFFADDANATNRGNSYFVWFRLDDQKIQLYAVNNNTFALPAVDQSYTMTPNTYVDFKIIHDRILNKVWAYANNILLFQYDITAPIASAGNVISFRSGNATMNVNDLHVYRSRNASVGVTVGSATSDIRYLNTNPATNSAIIHSICQDSANNISTIFIQDLNVDWTPPSSISTIIDGLTAIDESVTPSLNTLSSNWDLSSDINSGISNYFYSIGTTPAATNTLGWKDNLAFTSVTNNTLTLSVGTTYYFNVKAMNGSGLYSPVITSNGILVTTATSLSDYLKENRVLYYPNPTKELLFIQSELENYSLDFINSLGQSVLSLKHLNLNMSVNVSSLVKGIYMVKCTSVNGKTKVEKIVIE